MKDNWNNSDPYEYFMGRWSSRMAPVFLTWLNMPENLQWLDIGCGTGALSAAIAQQCKPLNLAGVDPSEVFIDKAKNKTHGTFCVADAENLPFTAEGFDVSVSGLALNFFPHIQNALTEIKRVTSTNGVVAFYVWDYANRMDFLRYFWDAAFQVDPNSRELDEGVRFPICSEANLALELNKAGFKHIETTLLDIHTIFSDFEDYWQPFLGGIGPAPSYLKSLDYEKQHNVKEKIRDKIHFEPDGSIDLLGRAIAVKAIK